VTTRVTFVQLLSLVFEVGHSFGKHVHGMHVQPMSYFGTRLGPTYSQISRCCVKGIALLVAQSSISIVQSTGDRALARCELATVRRVDAVRFADCSRATTGASCCSSVAVVDDERSAEIRTAAAGVFDFPSLPTSMVATGICHWGFLSSDVA